MATSKREVKGKCGFLGVNTKRGIICWNTTYKDDYVYKQKSLKEKSRLFTKEPDFKRPANSEPAMGGHSQTAATTRETKENSDYRDFEDSLKRIGGSDAVGDYWARFSEEMSSDNKKLPPITEAHVIYPNDLPKWDKPKLPGDILQPHPVALQAKEWK
ncbi:hypothetical protein Btru_058771, partial [Bulinus truncatus]